MTPRLGTFVLHESLYLVKVLSAFVTSQGRLGKQRPTQSITPCLLRQIKIHSSSISKTITDTRIGRPRTLARDAAESIKPCLLCSLAGEDGFGRVSLESPLVSLDIVDV